MLPKTLIRALGRLVLAQGSTGRADRTAERHSAGRFSSSGSRCAGVSAPRAERFRVQPGTLLLTSLPDHSPYSVSAPILPPACQPLRLRPLPWYGSSCPPDRSSDTPARGTDVHFRPAQRGKSEEAQIYRSKCYRPSHADHSRVPPPTLKETPILQRTPFVWRPSCPAERSARLDGRPMFGHRACHGSGCHDCIRPKSSCQRLLHTGGHIIQRHRHHGAGLL